MRYFMAFVLAALFLGSALWAAAAISTDQVPRMTKEQLVAQLNDPNVVVLDARQPGDWDKSNTKIKGAVRVDPKEKFGNLMDRYPKDKTLVFYCS